MTPFPALHATLRAETGAHHARLEGSPYVAALRAGTLPPLAALSFLRGLAIVHAGHERALTEASIPEVRSLAAEVSPRLPLLLADLERLDAARQPSVVPAVERALAFANALREPADDAFALVGVLYVLEGSRLGGAVLARDYARCLGVPHGTLLSFGGSGARIGARWERFTAALDALPAGTDEVSAVVRGAVACFDWFSDMCAALHPYAERDLKHHVAGLNPEAGRHAMPQDPREIGLALRAGAQVWARTPYLAHRFGERGRRFTTSDSCWLVALTQASEEVATKSLSWLRTVLVPRGLPTIVLEEHLYEIVRQLRGELDDGASRGARLSPFLAGLRDERERLGGEGCLSARIDAFEPRLKACRGFTVDGAARLITSAWVDERAGIEGALGATRDWFEDPDRFSPEWISEVRRLRASLDAGC